MSRIYSYLNSTKEVLQEYDGHEPCLPKFRNGRQAFASFLKKFFAANKKYGSKDRKQISHLCYCYFRLGKAAMDLPVDERILAGLFLCSDKPNEILQALKPEWSEKINLSFKEKYSILNTQQSIFNVFPWKEKLSEGIDHEKFCESFFVQPDLFLRIRPGHAKEVLLKLDKMEIGYEFISPFSIRLPNSLKTDQHFELDNEVVIQDYNSQHVFEFLTVRPGRSDRVWDCCAGSGGKSIMAYDINPYISLTVSDVRESILANLKKRFEKAGIKKYKSIVFDLSEKNILRKESFGQYSIFNNPRLTGSVGQEYSIIIADVPCTGSGTWSRTPEQLYFFEQKKIDEYASLQKKLVSNAIPHLKPGGYLLYITCSVFKKENEEIIDYFKEKFNLQNLKMEVLKGYDKKADTMFAALLQKPL